MIIISLLKGVKKIAVLINKKFKAKALWIYFSKREISNFVVFFLVRAI